MKKKKVKTYIEESICYGRDTKNRNIVLHAFMPLKITQIGPNADYVMVKPAGRGNYRQYLLRTKLLQFDELEKCEFCGEEYPADEIKNGCCARCNRAIKEHGG